MKNLIAFLLISVSVICSLQSCGNDDQPDFRPAKEYRPYNSNDSAAFCEIMKTAFGPNLDKVCDYYKMKLDSIPSWPSGMPEWQWFDDIKEYRVTYLFINSAPTDPFSFYPPDEDNPEFGKLSKSIWDLDSLRTLRLYGGLFHGDIPSSNGKGKRMSFINIEQTNISSIPLDIFTLPELGFLAVSSNPRLKRLPKGYESLPPDDREKPAIYLFQYNGFSGKCPGNLTRQMNFAGNNYDSVDWSEWETIDFSSKILKDQMGPFLYYNKIKGTFPEKLLNDTIAILYINTCLSPQDEGYGISGIPSQEEIIKMRTDFKKNHPEFKDHLL